MGNSNAKLIRIIVMVFLIMAGAIAFHSSAFAQGGGDRDRDRRDRKDGDDRSERDRGERDRSESLDRELRREKYRRDFDLKKFLVKLDVNKSGTLEKGELKSDRTRRYLSSLGINVDQAVEIDSAVRRAESAAAKKRDAEREKFENQVGPKLNSFGVQPDPLGVDSFGVSEEQSPQVASFDERLSGLKQSDFDEKTLADARKVLDGYDRDGSGFLEGDEISRIRWSDPGPVESDLNGDGRISMLEMAQRVENKSKNSQDKDTSSRDGKVGESGKRRPDQKLRDGDGGRGEGIGSQKFRGRGDGGDRGSRGGTGDRGGRSTRTDASRTATSSPSKPSRASVSKNKAYASYIDNVYKKYDTDKDGRLSADELKKMKRPFHGDTDKDGFLSKAEAIESIKSGQKDKQAAPANTGPKPVVSTSASRSDRGVARVSARQTQGGGLSGSVSGNRGSLSDADTNADGQIQMSEFSSTWDEKTLQSFRNTDTDGDGILSSEEWSNRAK